MATDESKKLYQKLNAYPNYKFIRQLNTEKLSLYLNSYTLSDINVISKILPKYLYFQQLTIGAFEPKVTQPQNSQSNNNNQLNYNYKKNRNSKSLGKAYKNTKQKESDKIQSKQKIFSSLQKHLSQTKNLLSLVIQSFKINNELSKYLSQGLSQNKSLQYISINYCVLPLDIYEIILKGILNHEIIRCIDLSNNKLNDKYCPMISRIIQRQTQRRDQIIWSYQLRNELPHDNNYKIGLISINLHGNQLEKQSAELITNALSSDQYIRYIDLSKNYFDNGACKLFIHMMRKNNTLLTVDLRENSGYDEFINPRIVMKMSKNIKFLYSQYQNGQYTDEEFEYLKGFIDISFFDVDIPQEIVEYYNNNVQQETDANGKSDNIIKNNLHNNQNENINNSNNINNNIQNNINNINNNNEKIDNNLNKNKVNNINNNNNNNNIINNNIINKDKEENKEEKGVIKKKDKNIKNENNININQIKNNKNNKIKNNNKENSALKENQKLIQENLQLKQEILELKAKNLQKMLADGLSVPQEEEKDLENYYNRANEIIDTLNEVMAKLQQHKTSNNNNNNNDQNDINELNLSKKKQEEIININNNNNNQNNNINENKVDIIKKDNLIEMSKNNQNVQNNDIKNKKIKNDIDNNLEPNLNKNNNNNININNNISNINDNRINIDDKNNLSEKEIKEKKIINNIDEKKEEKLKENNVKKEQNFENNKDVKDVKKNYDNNNNNDNISDDEENDFNFDDLTEEEKIALIQQREILMKLQEEAEARGEHFDIQEYLAQAEEQGEDEDDFGEQGQNNNKLNKSF